MEIRRPLSQIILANRVSQRLGRADLGFSLKMGEGATGITISS